LVIADAAKAVALAGVMGGEETGVTAATTDILLESAWFEPTRVRKTSRELGISTDSSYRFERRVDPEGVPSASGRATRLILESAGGSAEPEVLVAGKAPVSDTKIVLDNNRCRALLGSDISDEEIASILQKLGLTKSGDAWAVPSYRPDLTRDVDLIEEVIRIAGIERVPSRLRGFPAAAGDADLRHDNAEKLRARLRAQGFSEARTSHFVSPEALAKAGISEADAVKIRNPLGADQALLRPGLLSGLLEAVARNLHHGAEGVRLFELGPVFRSNGKEEQVALAVITTGRRGGDWQGEGTEADFYDLKGVLGSVLECAEFSAGEGLAVRVGGVGLDGVVRRLPRALAEACDAKAPVYYAEVLIDGWLSRQPASVRVKALPKFPAVQRDLSLILPTNVSYAAAEKALLAAKAPHLQSVALKDVFSDPSGAKLPAGQKSLTVTLTFREEARTLTSDEVDRAVETLRDHAKAELGAVFRA